MGIRVFLAPRSLSTGSPARRTPALKRVESGDDSLYSQAHVRAGRSAAQSSAALLERGKCVIVGTEKVLREAGGSVKQTGGKVVARGVRWDVGRVRSKSSKTKSVLQPMEKCKQKRKQQCCVKELAKLCEDYGYSHEWTSGQSPNLI